MYADIAQWLLGGLLIISSLGVILAKKPIHASLSFLFTLLLLALLYLQLSAEFIAAVQVLVYAGAILVVFIFAIILLQNAHQQLVLHKPKSAPLLLYMAMTAFMLTMIFLGKDLLDLPLSKVPLPHNFGTVESLGRHLYINFFFPFEAITLLFLVAAVGAVYIGKKEN